MQRRNCSQGSPPLGAKMGDLGKTSAEPAAIHILIMLRPALGVFLYPLLSHSSTSVPTGRHTYICNSIENGPPSPPLGRVLPTIRTKGFRTTAASKPVRPAMPNRILAIPANPF